MAALDSASIMKTANLIKVAPTITVLAKTLGVVGAVLSVGEVVLAWSLPNPVRTTCENARSACEQSIIA